MDTVDIDIVNSRNGHMLPARLPKNISKTSQNTKM